MPDFTAVYLRVSTDEQAQSGVSLSMQREMCEMYVRMHDLPTDIMVYEDDGKSAKNMDRPSLDRLRSDVTSRIIKNIVVFKIDRLTRNMYDLCTLMLEFDKYGVAMHGVRDKLDTSSASGRLIVHIMGAVAEWERETIADRTRSGLAHIKQQGYHLGAAPYGWEAIPHDGPGMLLRPTKQYDNIEAARHLHSKGIPLREIGLVLRGQNHPEAGRRMIESPLIADMAEVTDGFGKIIGYKYASRTT